MHKKSIRLTVFIILSLLLIYVLYNIPYSLIIQLDDNVILTDAELENIKHHSNGIVNTEIMQISARSEDEEKKLNEYAVKFKLFNLFNIKKLKVNVATDDELYVGGDSIGLILKSKGVVIVGSNYIITKQGNFNPFNESGLQLGDMLLKIDDTEINSVYDILTVLEHYEPNTELKMQIKRKGEELNLNIKPALDIQTNKYKLGLWIRDDAVGVGTLTFVNPDNLRFASLGHAIIDSDTKMKFEVNSGEIYKSNVIGLKQGKRGVPGEILGLFVQGRNVQGKVDKNTDNGVYGYLYSDEIVIGKKMYKIGGRLTAKPGKAKILTCLSGNDIKEYDIEIIKTNYQSKANEKSMIIKITDSELLGKTGGIIQGMSGSPIVQGDKIIGAVTHVFINDPTKGFGLYLDWMINE